MKRTTLFLLVAGLQLGTAAQPNLDSLYAVWKDPQRPDSVRAGAYSNYVWDGYLFSKPDTAFQMAEALIAYGEAHDLPRVVADAYNVQGTALTLQSNFARAIRYYENSIAIAEKAGYKQEIATSLGNIGRVYNVQGNYPEALDHFQRSLALYEELGNKRNAAVVCNNLGSIYFDQGDPTRAEAYFQRGLALSKEMGDKFGQAMSLSNLGSIYNRQKDNAKAREYYLRSLAIAEDLGNMEGKAILFANLGMICSEQGESTKAMDYYQRSFALRKELGDKVGMASSLTKIGRANEQLGDHALEYCSQAFTLAQEAGALDEQKDACQCLYDTYRSMGKGNEALRYLEQMRVLDDSLQAGETIKKLEQMEFNRQIFADSVAKAEEARVIEAAHTEEIRKKNRTRNYMALGGLGLLVVAGGLYSRARYMRRSRDIISKERDRSENLLLNILPAEIAAELKEKGRAEARDFEMVSILFTDFKGFTQASEKMSAAELVREINTCFEAFDSIVGRHGIEKIKTIGDAYMAAGGLPVPDVNAARNTVLVALEMQTFIETRHAERSAQGLPAFRMRVGIHTGPVVAGIVGVKKFQYDIWGDTVNTASRMESSGEVGQVNISEATYRLVVGSPLSVVGLGDGSRTTDNQQLATPAFIFTPRGKVQAKGKGEMEMYFVTTQRTT
ncbi:MAG: tetratricopeptide repeat protein [Flavobacteriales bacterium]|nr:tetratricopeptide repeat protein [Flavobacteriales bacterium]